MKRKLIAHGLSSLTVSLPQSWLKAHGLKKGDEVFVDSVKNNLKISATEVYEPKKVSIDISNSGNMIRKIIGATYKGGFDEVEIKFSSFSELQVAQEVIREQFSGFEIVEQQKDMVVIKNINQSNFDEFERIFRRLFYVLHHMSEEVLGAMSKGDVDWLQQTTLMKIETDTYADYCRRALNLGYQGKYERIGPLYTIIEQLEKIADRLVDIANMCIKNPGATGDNLNNIGKSISEFFHFFHSLFYSFSIEECVKFEKMKSDLQTDISHLLSTIHSNGAQLLNVYDEILQLIFNLNGPLLTINVSIEDK